MPRQKKDWKAFDCKADAELMRRFEEYCKEKGQTKTLAFERIIGAFLDEYEQKQERKTGTS